jgi:DNA-directed RNA polymerase subunit M/transcription elongation factor TFIIS
MDPKEKERYSSPIWPCKKCKAKTVWYTSDETYDGAYDRYHYHCHSCGFRWTVIDETD